MFIETPVMDWQDVPLLFYDGEDRFQLPHSSEQDKVGMESEWLNVQNICGLWKIGPISTSETIVWKDLWEYVLLFSSSTGINRLSIGPAARVLNGCLSGGKPLHPNTGNDFSVGHLISELSGPIIKMSVL